MVAGVLLILQTCAIEATYRGHLEVWNRTEALIRVVGREETLVVPACSHISRDDFVLNRYVITDDQGRFIAWHGGGGSNPASVTPVYEMITSEGAIYSDLKPPPEPLPPCSGTVRGQST
jgi:hypothetical protein